MFLVRLSRPLIRRSFASSTHNFIKKKATEYVRKSPIEHILLRPETYIGSVFATEQKSWIYNDETRKMEQKSCTFPPGLVKIFDEILVNAADNKQRDPQMTTIQVDVDSDKNTISVWNDGQTLPIEIHPTEGLYISSLVFGNLFTSSNYDDKTLRTVGGRNGFGAKLCNVYSEKFTVETGEKEKGKIFEQSWRDNMKMAGDVHIKEEETDDFTRITFSPDLAKFGIKRMSNELVEVFRKRAFDIAGTLPDVRVFFNGEIISINSFDEYIRLFCDDFLYLNYSPRWKVGTALSPSGFQQISFVNNITTTKGGRHVDLVADKITSSLKSFLEKQIGNNRTIRPSMIKNHLNLFVNSLIDNPSFESQTKEFLCTPAKKFGSIFEPNEEELHKWAIDSGLLELIVEELQIKKLSTKIRKNTKVIEEVSKLEDALLAGTSKANRCSLLITEGDSAKAFAVAGLEVVGREHFGVFPIRGKLINVSEIGAEKAVQNVEIANLMKILGLKFGEDYSIDENFATLRYGSIVILADQDEDGSHIKGLILNFIHHFWPELLTKKFVSSFRTPLVKAKKESKVLSFFSLAEFNEWRQKEREKGFSIKYYKGLGTSTSAEARDYFGNFEEHLTTYSFDEDLDGEHLKMAFDKNRADKRKIWIAGKREEGEIVYEFRREQSVKQFIDEELVNYSLADLRRSIPSVVDGLKPSQRKILHCLLQSKERKEIKVNQLAGAVSMSQSYHHGEESLVETIVKMAQNFPGSNNLNLLQPIGQFGTRHAGGADAARGRYIFTALSPLARIIFPKADDSLLTFIHEDGQPAEPKTFFPIVPLVLINGAAGIGTGWATTIFPHRPSKIIDAVKRLIEEKESEQLKPWWRGYGGSVQQIGENRYSLEGRMTVLRKSDTNSKVEITELPAGVWTNKYKQKVLLPLIKADEISQLKEQHSERSVRFVVTMAGLKSKKSIFTSLRLSSTISTNSMVLFDSSDSFLRNYKTTGEILREHFTVRKDIYLRRLEEEEKKQKAQLAFVENQLRFIRSVVDGEISLVNRSRQELEKDLRERGFTTNPLLKESDNFSFLLSLPLLKVTKEEIYRLEQKSSKQREQLMALRKNWQDEWLHDLFLLTREIRGYDG